MTDLSRLEDALHSKLWSWSYRKSAQCPACLLEVLTKQLAHIDPKSWQQRFSWGGIYVNGRAVSDNVPLSAPCKVEYYEPKFNIDARDDFFPAFRECPVLYRDEDILIIYKPARLPSLPGRDQTCFSLKTYLESYLKQKVHLPSRLDTSTCGVMAVSISRRMHSRLQKIFERRLVEKYYLFCASKQVEWASITVDSPIGRDSTHPVLRKVSPHGKKAVTVLTRLHTTQHADFLGARIPASLIEAKPLTGRTHQIRVHAASIGAAIVGDNFYNGLPAQSLHLVSWRISLRHPYQHRMLDVRLPDSLMPGWALPGQFSKSS